MREHAAPSLGSALAGAITPPVVTGARVVRRLDERPGPNMQKAESVNQRSMQSGASVNQAPTRQPGASASTTRAAASATPQSGTAPTRGNEGSNPSGSAQNNPPAVEPTPQRQGAAPERAAGEGGQPAPSPAKAEPAPFRTTSDRIRAAMDGTEERHAAEIVRRCHVDPKTVRRFLIEREGCGEVIKTGQLRSYRYRLNPDFVPWSGSGRRPSAEQPQGVDIDRAHHAATTPAKEPLPSVISSRHETLQLPIPGKASAFISLPRDIGQADWEMLRAVIDVYVQRMSGKAA